MARQSTRPTEQPADHRAHAPAARGPAPAPARASGRAKGTASSLGRAFQILELFTIASPVIQIDDVVRQLGYTRSTAYRYAKELCEAGLLTPAANAGQYSLGARIVELERLLVLTDPLYRAGHAVLDPLGQDDRSLLLQSLSHGNQVLCIYKKGPEILQHGGLRVALNRSRGVPFPLFRGAASLVILANLTLHRIRQTYLSDPARIAAAGLGQSWDEFRLLLAAIRRRGYAVSRSERKTPLVLGIAVPILLPAGKDSRVVGSLVQVCAHDLDAAQESAAFDYLRAAAERIAARYVEYANGMVPAAAPHRKAGGGAPDDGTPIDGWQLIS
ncbi:MAG TPA: helix-turn-helix domain-containing protein [Ramlibacter sp.]|nr:helix-turn-helix domain-containing protein [Ramlibacter sp.]